MDYKYTICERNIQRNKQAITTPESVKHHIILLLEARWEQRRCTRGSIGLGSMPLKFAVFPHYINTWVHVDEICKITAHSKRHGVHAKRQYTPWLLRCGVCVNKASRLFYQNQRSAVTRPADRSSQVTGDQLLAVNWRRASMHMYSCINLIKLLINTKECSDIRHWWYHKL